MGGPAPFAPPPSGGSGRGPRSMAPRGGSSGGSEPLNEAIFAEVGAALQTHIDIYEQVEGSKK